MSKLTETIAREGWKLKQVINQYEPEKELLIYDKGTIRFRELQRDG